MLLMVCSWACATQLRSRSLRFRGPLCCMLHASMLRTANNMHLFRKPGGYVTTDEHTAQNSEARNQGCALDVTAICSPSHSMSTRPATRDRVCVNKSSAGACTVCMAHHIWVSRFFMSCCNVTGAVTTGTVTVTVTVTILVTVAVTLTVVSVL